MKWRRLYPGMYHLTIPTDLVEERGVYCCGIVDRCPGNDAEQRWMWRAAIRCGKWIHGYARTVVEAKRVVNEKLFGGSGWPPSAEGE